MSLIHCVFLINIIIIFITILIRGGVAEKETIKSAFFIGYVVMQVDYYDVVMQMIQVISSNAIYVDVILKMIINDDGADVYEMQVPGGWLAEVFGTKRVFGFCT